MTADQTAPAADFQRRLVALQRAERLPAVAAAVARNGTIIFTGAAGAPLPTADTQFRIGSISKTFTAVLIMQLRDEGRLRLDDPLDQFVSGTVAGHVTLRMLLSHTSGLTQEPAGPFWEATGRSRDELLSNLSDDDMILPPGKAYHYSNVGFALLGQVVEALRGQPWRDVLHERILEPLALTRTTYAPTQPYAQGWRVHPFADVLTPEPHADTDAMAPAGQIWSTPIDLVRWGTFLATPVPEVLHPDSIEEMATPVSMVDSDTWTFAYGLGLDLLRYGNRIVIGHGGSMPGFSARLSVARRERVAAALVTNAWGGRQGTFVRDAVEAVLDATHSDRTWHSEDVPEAITSLLGTWWYRGLAFNITYHDGTMGLGQPSGARTSFAQVATDTFRATSGPMRGETLRVICDDTGQPVVLDVNTWLLTRTHDDPRGGP